MRNIIKLENGKEIAIDNNLAWLMEYQNQFGEDILPSLMPLVLSCADLLGGLADQVDDLGEINLADMLRILKSEAALDAGIKLSAFKTTDLINIIWALAKAADDRIDPPMKWIRQFEDGFPLDLILPRAVKAVLAGVISSKNLERLTAAWSKLQPETNRTSA